MNTATPTSPRTLSTLLHHIDLKDQTCTAAPTPRDRSDLERYLSDLLSEIESKPQRREYKLANANTQFGNTLLSLAKQSELAQSPEAAAMAERLLRIELTTEEKYGHLNRGGDSHVTKGSFLQFIYSDAGYFHYLGVKVEHQLFLDEDEFKRRIGLGESHKVYKACKISFDTQGNAGTALVFDTNSKPSVYWWRDFWELIASRTNSHNTEVASKEVVRLLNRVKRHSPVDHSILRNAAIAAFKQNGQMDFDQFITQTFANYEPIEPNAAPVITEIVEKMRGLPSQKGFDTQFELTPSAVPFRRVTIPLTSEIAISYEEGIPNLENKIWASRTKDGQDVLVIDAPQESTTRFKFKPLE